MKNLIPIIFIVFIFQSCMPTQLVYISVLEPAPVTLPPNIKNVMVVNRSMASDQAKPIDVVNKFLSLEGPNLDKDGALASITGLGDELMKNNRFTAVKALNNTDLRTNSPGQFPAPLPWEMCIRDSLYPGMWLKEYAGKTMLMPFFHWNYLTLNQK